MNNNKNLYAKLIPVMLCFFAMGFVDLVGIASNYVKADLDLTDSQANVFPSLVFFWFLIFSVPTGVLMNKIGRKKTVLLSLIITFASLLIPVFGDGYTLMLISFSLLGIGNALMQTSLNPLLSNIIAGDKLASTLTFGQFVKAIASFLAPYIAMWGATQAIPSLGMGWRVLFPIYMVIAVVAILWLGTTSIHEEKEEAQDDYTWKQYCQDIREGFHYLKKEKGIRNIYTYMSITSGVSDGNTVLIQAFYQTVPWLTVTMLGFLKSAEMIGRGLGGIFQYKKEIPVKKRYAFTKFVYTVYGLMDILLLYLPYPLMLCNRFLCGALGISSATIRETAVQSYLPENMRARINAFFNMVFAIGSVAFQMAAGALGQIMSYRFAILLLATIELTAMFLLICLPAKENRPVYEAVRNAE